MLYNFIHIHNGVDNINEINSGIKKINVPNLLQMHAKELNRNVNMGK